MKKADAKEIKEQLLDIVDELEDKPDLDHICFKLSNIADVVKNWRELENSLLIKKMVKGVDIA
tara:strand:+ start:724 stop:912 length:189 start_codon:yes stop_codon:yes gene_type:complete